MTVALYVRVSTDEQAEQGFSIDVQKERLVAFSKSQGWDDYKLYIDDGYTGTKLDRPAMNRLLRHIEEGQISAVCVYKLDRLGRKQKDVLYLLEDVFEKHGVAFKSSTEPFDTSTPFGKAMIGVLAVFAQLERDMIVERTTSGRREQLKQGIWSGGRIPFGYSWDKGAKQLEIVPDEAALVKEVFRMALQGQPYLAIADWISDRSKARFFDHNVIKEMLARPIYYGKLISGGTIVDGNHEAIVDEETWFAVQREMSKRRGGQPSIGEYLLTGLLQCGECGGPIVHVKRITNRRGKRYEYQLYACKDQHVRQKDRRSSCKLGYVRREAIERFVEEQIDVMSKSRKKVYSSLQRNTGTGSDEDGSENVVASLRAKLEKINAGLENLYDAIQSGEIKVSALSPRIKKLEEEREAIDRQLDDHADNTTVPSGRHDIANAFVILKQLNSVWHLLDIEEKKMALRKIILKVTLNKDAEPEITWNIKA